MIEVLDFSDASFTKLLPLGAPAVRYLHSYLSALNAQSILVEVHYVDRHYLDEFSHYYARSFQAPSASCARLHFFEALTAKELSALLDKAYADRGSRDESEALLNVKYLGFVVRRPLSAATIGRTVLRTYPVEGRRNYSVRRPYKVNVAGLQLVVEGLAYQQQDRGAAVCASTALWSALQRVAYVDGHRTPTPSAITRAAKSPYPATNGLSVDQMASALDALGYIAESLVPLDNRPLFRAEVGSYLESHLPVILLINTKMKTGAGGEARVGHAVTITGYSATNKIVDVIPQVYEPAEPPVPIKMRAGALDVIYVHDDNLGSHAHYELFDSDETNEQGHKKLMLRRGRSGGPTVEWWKGGEWHVEGALVPKPSKLRLPLCGLFDALLWMRSPLEKHIFPGIELHYGVRFESGVTYRRNMADLAIDPSQLRSFQSLLTLPRHIGVVSAYTGDDHLCDVIIDVSEVDRNPQRPSVVAFVAPGVPLMSQAHMNLMQLQFMFSCPLITAAARTS